MLHFYLYRCYISILQNTIKNAYKKFGIICEDLGLTGKEIIAVGGGKFRASNSRKNVYSEKKIEKKIEHQSQKADEYLKLLDTCDVSENGTKTEFSREEILIKVESANKRIKELERMKQEVKENGSIYLTDEDAKMMITNNKGMDICHNIQVAVDNKHKLIVAVDVTSDALDKEQLYNMSLQSKANINAKELTVLADKGYYSASQFEKCENSNIHPIVPGSSQRHHAVDQDFEKDKFIFNEESEHYVCPAGKTLVNLHWKIKGRERVVKYGNAKACKVCSLKNKCTTARYRTIQD